MLPTASFSRACNIESAVHEVLPPATPAQRQAADDFARSIDAALKRAQARWSGKSFEEMNAGCIAAIAKIPPVQLKTPPRIPNTR